MTALSMALAIGLPWLMGHLFVTLVMGKRLGPVDRAFLGFGSGFGLLVLLAFLLGLLGVRLGMAALLAAQLATVAIMAAAGCYLKKGEGPEPPAARPSNRAGAVLLALGAVMAVWVAAKVAFVLFEGLMRPMASYDTWLQWSAGAKLFYYSGSLLLDRPGEFFFGSGYRLFMGHPLLTTLSQLWVATALGHWDEALVKAWQPFYFASMLGVLYFAVRASAGGVAALAAAFFLAASPLLSYHGVEGYADLPLSYYVLAGSALLWRHMETGCNRSLALSGVMFAMGAFTKNEGALFLAFAGGALALFSLFGRGRGFRAVLLFALPALLYILPWLIFKNYHGLGFGHSHSSAGVNWGSALHMEVLPVYFRELFLSANHGLVFPFFFAVVIAGAGVVLRTNLKYLCLMVFMAMAAFLAVYVGTRDYAAVTQVTGVHRNLLTFMPLVLLTAALTAARLLKGQGRNGE